MCYIVVYVCALGGVVNVLHCCLCLCSWWCCKCVYICTLGDVVNVLHCFLLFIIICV